MKHRVVPYRSHWIVARTGMPPFPLAPHLNAHARADRNSLAIRRLWTDLITGQWAPRY